MLGEARWLEEAALTEINFLAGGVPLLGRIGEGTFCLKLFPKTRGDLAGGKGLMYFTAVSNRLWGDPPINSCWLIEGKPDERLVLTGFALCHGQDTEIVTSE